MAVPEAGLDGLLAVLGERDVPVRAVVGAVVASDKPGRIDVL